jgi:3-oxoadipate enol-lactonase
MPTVQLGGVAIHHVVEGSGEPLLLVAGQGSDLTSWDPLIADFAARHTCIRWDHRGTGASDKPRRPPYSIEGFAADAIALLDHLGIDRAHAYGVSMGGRICQRLAISHPDRLGAVVLGCTTPGNRHGVRRPPEAEALFVDRDADVDTRVERTVELMVSPGWAAANPWFVERTRDRIVHPLPDHALKLHYLASEAHEAWDELPGITNPVLVIHGDDDLVNVSANAALLADRIPGAELHLVPGGRHAYFVEFRPEASRVVLDFLARHPLGDRTGGG